MAQFGISPDPGTQTNWASKVIKDDPVKHKNARGTISYGTSGPNTRSTQLFINFKDNSYLDREGFAPIGEVVEGMESTVDHIEKKYSEKPSQEHVQRAERCTSF